MGKTWQFGSSRLLRKTGAGLLAAGLITSVFAGVAPGAQAVPTTTGVFAVDAPSTAQSINQGAGPNCNGIIPTPGSGKDKKAGDGDADKALNLNFTNDATPGTGTVHWVLTFNTHSTDASGAFLPLNVQDCVVWYPAGHFDGVQFNSDGAPAPGNEPAFKQGWNLIRQATFDSASVDPNENFFYNFTMPANDANGNPIPAGSTICNFAKNTSHSNSGAGNRKTGAACIQLPAAANPTISTVASPATAAFGQDLNDTATLADVSTAAFPTGTVTFTLYGPSDTVACTNQVFTTTVPLSGTSDSVTSTPAFAPGAGGTYYCVASYSGDKLNNAAHGSCGDTGETVTVHGPTISTVASAGGAVGTAVTDTAAVSSLAFIPNGNVTFDLYGPSASPNCTSSAAFESVVPVASNGTATSTPSFAPATAGTYYWTASYAGDTNGNPAVSEPCGGANESVTITPIDQISTVASAGGVVGTAVTDTATVSSSQAFTPPGNVTFDLFGPSATPDCTSTPAFESVVPIAADGTATSTPAFAPASAGTYYWTASYSGNPGQPGNPPVSEGCGGANESVTITTPPSNPPPVVVTNTPTAPDLAITKTGPATVAQGGALDYTVTASNTGNAPATGVVVTDAVPAGTTFVSETQTSGPTFTCTDPAVGAGPPAAVSCTLASLAAGASATFAIVDQANANVTSAITNTATVTATNVSPSDTDDSATVITQVEGTVVLPLQIVQPPTVVPPAPTAVLGEQVTRAPATLPFTGLDSRTLMLLAGLLLLAGGALLVVGEKRPSIPTD